MEGSCPAGSRVPLCLVGAEGAVERAAHGNGGGTLAWAPGEDCVLDVLRMCLAEPWTGGCEERNGIRCQ